MGSLDQKMIVVGHQNINGDQYPIPLVNTFKKSEKASKVPFCHKNCSFLISSCSYVIKSALIFDSQRPRHDDSPHTMFLCLMSRPDTESLFHLLSYFFIS